MSEPGKTTILGDALRAELKELLREVIREELARSTNGSGQLTRHDEDDGVVNSEKAARYLGVSRSWLYKNSYRLPFAVKVGGSRRFCKRGMRRWLENQRR
jgi:predicted DNA-binding transcriptional regulator AlpA